MLGCAAGAEALQLAPAHESPRRYPRHAANSLNVPAIVPFRSQDDKTDGPEKYLLAHCLQLRQAHHRRRHRPLPHPTARDVRRGVFSYAITLSGFVSLFIDPRVNAILTRNTAKATEEDFQRIRAART